MGLKQKKQEKPKQNQTPTKYLEVSQVDYGVYIMTKYEKIGYFLAAAIVLFAVGYIFYKSVILSLLFSLLAFKYPPIAEKSIAKKRQKELSLQFKDMLYSLSSAVNSGASVESGITMARDDMLKQYVDPKTMIIQELNLMVSRLSFGMNVEEVFGDFAKRSHNEDVLTFTNIFEISKRQGGNIMQIIRQTTNVISEKVETKSEIETALAGRKSEQKVMTAMPICLVGFMTYTTDGFMDPIFTTIVGRIVATAAIGLIIIGYLWSSKITDIEV